MTSLDLPEADRDTSVDGWRPPDVVGDGPLVVIVGNCQAESLRIMLGTSDVSSIRLPAVHELTEAHLPFLDRLLARTDILVTQPVRNDYHGLPVGTAQLRARMAATARTVVVPVIRFAGLYPTQAIVRPPADPSLQPPVVPYHDLQTLMEAAGYPPVELHVDAVRAIAALSIRELERRETFQGAVAISDIFGSPDFDAMRTINHPGNIVFAELARRVRRAASLGTLEVDPGRPILASIHAPKHPVVIEAFGLEDASRENWIVDDVPVSDDEVRAAQLEWYRRNPEVVTAGLARHAEAVDILRAA